MADLDEINRRILRELTRDARISNLDLAARAGLSPSACLRRVQEMERAGVIRGYRAVLDPGQMGVGFVAYVAVGLSSHTKAAQEAFERAITLAPREGSAYVNLGNILLDARRELGRAVELLTTGVKLLPRNAPALNSLAVALKSLGRFDEATAVYARAIALQPAHAALHYNLGLLHAQRAMDARAPPSAAAEACARARELFGVTLRLQPSHVGAKQSLASLAGLQCGRGLRPRAK